MIWIDAKELQNWAGRRDSQSTLPYLVRRLIRATCGNIDTVSFPAGDSISKAGWDGILNTKSGNEFVPEGVSVWEFGTDQSIKTKADSDYKKRCLNPLGINPSNTTFVFVTPRAFTKNRKWIDEKRATGFWKDVRVINSDQLEEWIEQAPGVGVWLALHLNRVAQGVISADDWWSEWIKSTDPPIIKELLLSGRENEERNITKFLRKPGCYPISGNTPEEVIAFIIASFINSEDNITENFFSRAIIVKSEESYRKLIYEIQRPLVLISYINEPELNCSAIEKGHTVFLAIGIEESDNSDDTITLSKCEHKSFVDALIKMGYSNEDAYRQEKDTNRNLSIFRRKILKIKKSPIWSLNPDIRELIPFFLVGNWDSNEKYCDRDILTTLFEKNFESIEILATKWEKIQDSPLKHIRTIWFIQSPYDIWYWLGRKVTSSDLKNLKTIALTVLGSDNPVLDLDLSKRWLAELYEKIPPYSNKIRKGIASSLLIIAVFGQEFKINMPMSAQSYVDSIVLQLLDDADGRRWCSLNDIIPILAEASPTVFLNSIEKSLESSPSTIIDIFPEKDDQMHPSDTHTGLLWGLEILAWNPDYLGRVALIFVELSKKDPGGVYVNRPYNSLKNIFLLWYPHTYASLESRIKVLDIILKRDPDIGWDLLIDLISKINGVSDHSPKPRWRRYDIESEPPVSRQEFETSITYIVERIFAEVNESGIRWSQIFSNIHKLPPTIRDDIYSKVRDIKNLGIQDQLVLWNSIRAILASHRSHPTAHWVFSEDEISKIEELYVFFTPKDRLASIQWLFDSPSPNLPKGKLYTKDYKTYLTNERTEAIKSLIKEKGNEGLIELIASSKSPQSIGETCSEINVSFGDQEIFSFLDSENKSLRVFAQTDIQIKSNKQGAEWIKNSISISISDNWAPSKILDLLIVLPENGQTWELITKYTDKIQKDYWERCNGTFYNLSSSEREIGINQLISVGRLNTAITIVSISDRDLPPLLIIELLEQRLKSPLNEEFDREEISSYHIIELFKWLDSFVTIKPEIIPKMISLEFAYLTILCDIYSDRPPKYLFQAVSVDPKMFANLIEIVFKPEDSILEETQLSQTEQNYIVAAYELLQNFDLIPGINEHNDIDISILRSWIESTRSLCNTKKRSKIGDKYIGRLLGSTPYKDKSSWPPKEICCIIEENSNSSMREGFVEKVLNQRDATTRDLIEGGIQERELIESFSNYSRQLSRSYPRTSGLIEKIVSFYRDDAIYQDEDAEIMDSEI